MVQVSKKNFSGSLFDLSRKSELILVLKAIPEKTKGRLMCSVKLQKTEYVYIINLELFLSIFLSHSHIYVIENN